MNVPFRPDFAKGLVSYYNLGWKQQVCPPTTSRPDSVGLIYRSDFAILLIAIHTALTVLRSRKSVGLQHYRYPAYACCAVLAILMAALAFVNSDEQHSYISQGTFCWLPVRPIWYRLTFSWVPRYFILCTIIAIYGTIYVYTVRQFGKFNTTITTSTQASNTASGEVHDGLADPSPGSRTSHWFWQSGDGPPESENERQDLTSRSDSARVAGSSGQYHQSTFPPSERVERRPTLLQALRDKTLLIKNRDPTDSNSNNALHKQHKAIQRQLRYMFIYPLVYLLMWIAPFINHCYFYTRQHDPPFVLSCISLVSVCLQCAADCLIFCLRERPWEQSVHGHSGRDKRRSIDESFKDSIELADIDGAAGVPSQAPETGGIRNVVKPPVVRQFRKDKNWWDGENI